MSSDQAQSALDGANKDFWNELCGTHLAQTIGITDDSPESLKKFDDWYFDYYPYLHAHIPFADLKGKSVLEAGLGYGSVSQKIAESGAQYFGLDIAPGPVAMVRHRLYQLGLKGLAQEGSVLDCPYDDATFDWVVSIGCLHHTGDMQQAILELHRILRPGGQAMVMVYNANSYRAWIHKPFSTLRKQLSPRNGTDEGFNKRYDTNREGAAPPLTEFVTKSELRQLCRAFSSCRIKAENIDLGRWLRWIPRPIACKYLGPAFGLDLYCHLQK